jgi:hypothetical protein
VKRCLAAVVLIAAVFCYRWLNRPIIYAPGVLIAAEPSQILCHDDAFDYHAFHLTPLARYELDARVLHTKRYRNDRGAALVPIDVAVGWGGMSDQRVLDQLEISQSMRFYWYRYRNPPPLPPDEIKTHSANIHVIPANDSVAARVEHLRAGALVHLRGQLVEASGPKLATWRSSLRRDDTGNGAC